MANSDVYCNGELLGHRPYGYVSFNYDLTPHLHAGKNIIAVRVDNSQQPASRWYPGAGINRQVRLIATSAIHIAPWGTFVTTPTPTGPDTTVNVRSTVTNDSDSSAEISLDVTLHTPQGKSIKHSAKLFAKVVAPHSTADLEDVVRVANPDLWDLDHPVLYTPTLTPDWDDVTYLTATLLDPNGTVLPDSETRVHFSVSGPAKIIAVDNGNLLDHDPFHSTSRKLFEGHAIAILRATAPNGTITLTATTESLPPATLVLQAHPAKPSTMHRSF
jgi:Glycoside hydrolase family 2 C-terminal domain 5/Glycosyl hydrolases family 2, sugar binding domain